MMLLCLIVSKRVSSKCEFHIVDSRMKNPRRIIIIQRSLWISNEYCGVLALLNKISDDAINILSKIPITNTVERNCSQND